MLADKDLDLLSRIFPGEELLLRSEEKCVFGADAGRRFAPPDAVVRPRSAEQVCEFLALAQERRIPVHTRARATNVVGGCVPEGGGVVLSTLGLNRVLEIDPEDFICRVEPGVVTATLQEQLAARGLFYPPDPASRSISTIGGNVATGAGGMVALKYGVTRDYVLGINAALPGGALLATGSRAHKNVVGLDLTRLFVGSEGTLGVITEATLKLLPRPEATVTVLAGFAELESLLAAARAVFASGRLPAAMEFMADTVLDALAAQGDVPWDGRTRAVLLMRLDGARAALETERMALVALLEKHAPTLLESGGDQAEERLWEVRRMVNPASYRIASDKLSSDISVPRGKIGAAVTGVREISREQDLPILCFGHLGDGNLHVNVMYDASDDDQKHRATAARDAVLELALSLSGTLSGEHGVGLARLPHLDRQLSGLERDLMGRVKAVFDPHGIMNPGKSF